MDKMYLEKEQTAKKVGCKYYIHLNDMDMIAFRLVGKQNTLLFAGANGEEFIITKDDLLIRVTCNSCDEIRNEANMGVHANGFIGTVHHMWYADSFQKLF